MLLLMSLLMPTWSWRSQVHGAVPHEIFLCYSLASGEHGGSAGPPKQCAPLLSSTPPVYSGLKPGVVNKLTLVYLFFAWLLLWR